MIGMMTEQEIVIRLRGLGAPLDKAEKAARAHVAKFGVAPQKPRDVPRSVPTPEVLLFPDFAVANGLLRPIMEHRFMKPRRWRFDFAWPGFKVALECEGGIWTGGRHTRGSGYVKDMEKYNAATTLGWSLYRTTPSALNTDATIRALRAMGVL